LIHLARGLDARIRSCKIAGRPLENGSEMDTPKPVDGFYPAATGNATGMFSTDLLLA